MRQAVASPQKSFSAYTTQTRYQKKMNMNTTSAPTDLSRCEKQRQGRTSPRNCVKNNLFEPRLQGCSIGYFVAEPRLFTANSKVLSLVRPLGVCLQVPENITRESIIPARDGPSICVPRQAQQQRRKHRSSFRKGQHVQYPGFG